MIHVCMHVCMYVYISCVVHYVKYGTVCSTMSYFYLGATGFHCTDFITAVKQDCVDYRQSGTRNATGLSHYLSFRLQYNCVVLSACDTVDVSLFPPRICYYFVTSAFGARLSHTINVAFSKCGFGC